MRYNIQRVLRPTIPHQISNGLIVRIFDEIGDGFISVEKFKFILKEIDEDFTDEELEEVILEV